MQRLKTRPQFQAALAGNTIAKTPHFALHCVALKPLAAANGPAPAAALFGVSDVWIGALVPKRWAKRAVTRHTIKRQIYTVSAEFEPRFSQAAHVVRLRAGFSAGPNQVKWVSATSDALKTAIRLELNLLFAKVGAAQ